MKKTIAISTGGTGGHVFPAIAMATELVKNNYNVISLIDYRAHKFNNYWPQQAQLYTVKSKGISSKSIISIIYVLIVMFLGLWQSLYIFIKNRPNILISFGGYSSVPVITAAFMLNIKIIIHEQNAVIGKTNKLFLPLAKALAISFNTTVGVNPKYLHKTVITGLPLRKEFYNIVNNSINNSINNNKINFVIMGGSLGAKIFAEEIPQAFLKLNSTEQEKFVVYHQCVTDNINVVQSIWNKTKINATVLPFFNNVINILQNSHVVLSRAGASGIFEIAILNKLAILVPYKLSAHNHQLYNAEYAKAYFNSKIILEDSFNSNILYNYLQQILNNKLNIYNIKNNLPNASTLLLQLIEDIIKNKRN